MVFVSKPIKVLILCSDLFSFKVSHAGANEISVFKMHIHDLNSCKNVIIFYLLRFFLGQT